MLKRLNSKRFDHSKNYFNKQKEDPFINPIIFGLLMLTLAWFVSILRKVYKSDSGQNIFSKRCTYS